MSSTNDEQQSIDVRINRILAKVDISDDVSITLPMSYWRVLKHQANLYDVSVDRVVERYVREHVMTMMLAAPPGGDSPSTS